MRSIQALHTHNLHAARISIQNDPRAIMLSAPKTFSCDPVIFSFLFAFFACFSKKSLTMGQPHSLYFYQPEASTVPSNIEEGALA